jgi:hypothetical protein
MACHFEVRPTQLVFLEADSTVTIVQEVRRWECIEVLFRSSSRWLVVQEGEAAALRLGCPFKLNGINHGALFRA